MYDDALAVTLTTMGRQLDSHFVVEILCSNGMGLEHLCRSALEDHLASFATSLRTDIYNIVGSQHHVAVVLYHNDGIAQVTQFFQTVDESFVIALVKTYTGLIEDIEHIDQLASNLCGKTYTLTFTSRERSRLTVE